MECSILEMEKYIGPFDLLAAFKTSEVNRLVDLFGEEMREAASYGDEAFYFIDLNERVIIPMKILAYAFGGQYNDDLPYGKEDKAFIFHANEYRAGKVNV